MTLTPCDCVEQTEVYRSGSLRWVYDYGRESTVKHTLTDELRGSIPLQATKIGLVVQMVRIPACHAGGREFESRPAR